MSLLEGHGEFVMSRAGAGEVTGAPRFAAVLAARRASAKGLVKLVQQALGLEAKLRQYSAGRRFIEAVEAGGGELFSRVWESPEMLPTLEEIGAPRTLDRPGGRCHRSELVGRDVLSPLAASLLGRCAFPARGEPLACAVSGGADSLALLALAVAAGCEATAYHVDHGIRPGSAGEADVVRAGAERLGAGFIGLRVEVAAGPNLEARARAGEVRRPSARTSQRVTRRRTRRKRCC